MANMETTSLNDVKFYLKKVDEVKHYKPSGISLFIMRDDEGRMYSPAQNVSMYKTVNAADIADAMTGDHLGTNGFVTKGTPLDTSKFAITMTRARVSVIYLLMVLNITIGC